MLDFNALSDVVRQLKGRDIIFFTEPRFDDLFYFPSKASPARTAIRLNFRKGAKNTVALCYRRPSNDTKQDIIISETLRTAPSGLAEMLETPIDLAELRKLLEYSHKGVPVGIHAWEAVLRRDTEICQSLEASKIASELIDEIAFQVYLIDVIFHLTDAFSPTFFFSGHDCYASATVKNSFISKKIPSLTLYKYMYNPIYHGPDLGYRQRGEVLFSRRFSAMLDNSRRSVWEKLAEKAKSKLDSITRDYRQLNYIRAESISRKHSEYNYERATGLSELKQLDSNGHFWGDHGDPAVAADEPVFVLALHSFADEATMYGVDSFVHMFDYFSSVACGVSQVAPRARIAVRFHPNTLGENLHEVELRDCTLQRALFQKIRSENRNVMVSCCSARLGELKSNHQLAVVTRWGTIGLECMHLGIPFLCTALAPYAALLDSSHIVSSRQTLGLAIAKQLENIENGDIALPRDEMYRFAASVFLRENGNAREPSFVFSREGASYLAARGRSDARIRNTLGDTFVELNANRESAKHSTCDELKRYLKRNSEQAEDAAFLAKVLGW